VTLPKHLRPRWRYVAVELETWPDAAVGREAFERAVRRAARGLLGDPGEADARLDVVDFAVADGAGRAALRVRHGEVEPARAALACVHAVGSESDSDGGDERDDRRPVGIRVLGVSGTLRACRRRYDTADPASGGESATVTFEGEPRRATLREHDGTTVADLHPGDGDGEASTGATAEDVGR